MNGSQAFPTREAPEGQWQQRSVFPHETEPEEMELSCCRNPSQLQTYTLHLLWVVGLLWSVCS